MRAAHATAAHWLWHPHRHHKGRWVGRRAHDDRDQAVDVPRVGWGDLGPPQLGRRERRVAGRGAPRTWQQEGRRRWRGGNLLATSATPAKEMDRHGDGGMLAKQTPRGYLLHCSSEGGRGTALAGPTPRVPSKTSMRTKKAKGVSLGYSLVESAWTCPHFLFVLLVRMVEKLWTVLEAPTGSLVAPPAMLDMARQGAPADRPVSGADHSA